MNILSRYAFVSTYNAEKLTKQEATSNGVGANDFSKCDTDGDGNITIDEILANQEVCDKLLKAIQAKIDKVSVEETAVKSEAAKAENSAEKFELAA